MEVEAVLLIGGLALVAMLIIMIALSKLLLIAQPNEVVILSGRKRTLPDGTFVGYRVIRGGRALRIPFLEKASRMSLETIPIELSVQNAYSKGGIPLAVDAIANIKIDSKEPYFGNAVERFLQRSEGEIQKIAKETLEGNLRGVLASLTPEEVNEDRMKFAEELMSEADQDLQKLGIQLDTLKITNISDERGYLDSIGRMKSAEVVSNAKKAEAEKQAEALEAEAAAHQKAETAKARSRQEIETAQIQSEQNVSIAKAKASQLVVEAEAVTRQTAETAKAKANMEIERAQIEAQQNVSIAKARANQEVMEAEATTLKNAETAKARANQDIESAKIETEQNVKINKAKANQLVEIENNNYRVKKAELEKEAIIKEKEAEVAGTLAKVKYEQELESQRIQLQQRKLIADVIEPAKAKKEALELEARGQASSIIADGEAQLAILKQNLEAFTVVGDKAESIYKLVMLPKFIDSITGTLKGINIDKITMIDNATGNSGENGSFSRFVNQIPGTVAQLSETIKTVTGVDFLKAMTEKKED